MNSLLLWMEQEKIALTEEQKERIAAFEQELQQAKALAEELQKDVEQRQMAQLVEEALRQAGGRNIPVLWALLDKERLSLVDGEIQGLAEQLKELKESEDTAFLFAGRHAQPQFVTVGKTARLREDGARAVMGLR